jgi:hypothetical protein
MSRVKEEKMEQRVCPNGHVFMVSLLAKELAYFPGIITSCPRCGEQSWRDARVSKREGA